MTTALTLGLIAVIAGLIAAALVIEFQTEWELRSGDSVLGTIVFFAAAVVAVGFFAAIFVIAVVGIIVL